jgi:hypothetical protein
MRYVTEPTVDLRRELWIAGYAASFVGLLMDMPRPLRSQEIMIDVANNASILADLVADYGVGVMRARVANDEEDAQDKSRKP